MIVPTATHSLTDLRVPRLGYVVIIIFLNLRNSILEVWELVMDREDSIEVMDREDTIQIYSMDSK